MCVLREKEVLIGEGRKNAAWEITRSLHQEGFPPSFRKKIRECVACDCKVFSAFPPFFLFEEKMGERRRRRL